MLQRDVAVPTRDESVPVPSQHPIRPYYPFIVTTYAQAPSHPHSSIRLQFITPQTCKVIPVTGNRVCAPTITVYVSREVHLTHSFLDVIVITTRSTTRSRTSHFPYFNAAIQHTQSTRGHRMHMWTSMCVSQLCRTSHRRPRRRWCSVRGA